MIAPEIQKMYEILVCFLGKSKKPLDETYQLQFSCPRCQSREGVGEANKFHLEVNLASGIFNCWKCSSIDDKMHGSVFKLIKMYGSPLLLSEYKNCIREFKNTSLYKLNKSSDETSFTLDENDDLNENKIVLPNEYIKFDRNLHGDTKAFKYLQERGINWRIIEDFNIGFTTYQETNKKLSNRIILPSYDEFGDVNYWTGRDFTKNPKRQRYDNAKADRKTIIFNEDKVQWNADITLVEGPFDSIVVPNSIPLLGKALNEDFKLYHYLFENANAHINIFLDGDAIETTKALYRVLDKGRLKDKIRYIFIPIDDRELDPSKIFQLYGRKGIIQFINSAKKLT
jgi:hypothetical protein